MENKYTVITNTPPEPKAYNDLRVESGISTRSVEGAAIGLQNSLFAVYLYDDETLVGMGRLIGDGGTVYHVVDVVVKPSYQGKGLGKYIMGRIVHYLDEHAHPNSYVSLIADDPADKLYEKFGFNYTYPSGHGMYKRY